MKRKGIGEEQEYKTISPHLPKWMSRKTDDKYDLPLFDYYTALDHFENRKIKSRIAHKGYTEGRPDT